DLAAIESRAPGLYVLAHRDARDGRLDAAALQRLVPDLARREVFVCGPAGLMDMVSDVATAAGAPVHHERFVAAPLVRARDSQPANHGASDSQPGNHGAPDSQPSNHGAPVLHAIQLRGRRVTVAGTGPLLAELERAGERPPHGCRMGICNSCRCHKASGTVEDLVTGAVSSEPDQEIRLCVSVARSDLELAL
ncbi:MAG TPA: 2Fe-2S iron-sulfur cluster-binding protein, partial [Kofleriaceae bacterium]|nr:2Fe-2S iron-sulfur cluster-binding protein [Kofleriaceae bacterium]